MTVVQVRWYGPYGLENINTRDIASYMGVYAIYSVFGGKESLLYIGKTSRSFNRRINEHYREWLWNVRGEIKIRFGILEYPHGGIHSVKKLNDMESLLIHWHRPPYNTSSIEWYRGRLNLEVINVGRRGLLDRNVTTSVLTF
ncbi:GIY-YIG nuclease family protein [Neobacillus rhizosphaerae]|uniref:GIY-YIG nuclease family protein n=1 Tax=Neobacillus rhizosphaerae TaxID=2880965 RepID=UPI003D28FA4C